MVIHSGCFFFTPCMISDCISFFVAVQSIWLHCHGFLISWIDGCDLCLPNLWLFQLLKRNCLPFRAKVVLLPSACHMTDRMLSVILSTTWKVTWVSSLCWFPNLSFGRISPHALSGVSSTVWSSSTASVFKAAVQAIEVLESRTSFCDQNEPSSCTPW